MSLSQPESLIEMVARINTVSLASLDASGDPCCSYAPYVYVDGRFYLFLSGLAAHCRNMLARPVCDIMLIEDESQTKNLFARRRAMIRCTVDIVSRDVAEFSLVAANFRTKFGPTIDMLVGLPDFTLFRLLPQSGMIVQGFGNAIPIHFSQAQTG
jgi:putative heme iron utilization protein